MPSWHGTPVVLPACAVCSRLPWRKSTRRLVLARDRMGIKPLYLAKYGSDLLFGSELKAILIHPEVERRLSMEGLDCYLTLNYVPCPWTLVNGVEKLPPGHWYECTTARYGQNPIGSFPPSAPRVLDLESAKQELDFLLEQSVREHLLSDVPLGVWLSGGMILRPSCITRQAPTMHGSRLFLFSFNCRSFDETEHIQRVVSHYGTDHEQLDLNPEEDLQGAIEQFAYYSDEPSADAGALPVWFLSRMCKTHATVALSGEGADEIFCRIPYVSRQPTGPDGADRAFARDQAGARGIALLARLRREDSAWNTNSNAFSKAACCLRNRPMFTGMEPSPNPPKRLC